MNIHKNPGISQSLFVIPALVRRHSQVHPTFSLALQCATKLITITPIVLLYQSSEILVTPVPVVRDPSYSEGRPEYPPRVWYSPEIDASKFALHILSDTPGVFQGLKYILLMLVHLETSSITATKCISKLAQSGPPSASMSYMIIASKCISKLARWQPPSASLSYTISASKRISKLAQSWPPSASLSSTWSLPPSKSPNSLNHGLQVHLWVHSIIASKWISYSNLTSASKCISKLSRSQPPCSSPSSHDHGLQVHLHVLSMGVSWCSSDYAPVLSAARLAICIYIARLR